MPKHADWRAFASAPEISSILTDLSIYLLTAGWAGHILPAGLVSHTSSFLEKIMKTHESTPFICLILRDGRVKKAIALRDFDAGRLAYLETVEVVPMKTIRERFYDSCPRFVQEDDKYGASEGGSYACRRKGDRAYQQKANRNSRSDYQYRLRNLLAKSRELQGLGIPRLDAHRAASRMSGR